MQVRASPVGVPIDHERKVRKSQLMVAKQLWVFVQICAGLATLSAQRSTVAEPHKDSLDWQCQGQGRTPDELIEACDRLIASGGGALFPVAQAFALRANHFAAKHEYDRAIEDYSRSIQLDPRIHAAFFNRGLAYVAIGDDDRAMQDFDEQIRLQRDYDSAYRQRGLIWARRQKFDLAIREFDVAVRLSQSSSDRIGGVGALYLRGQARLGMRDYDRAIDDLSQAIAIAPSFADPYKGRSEAHRFKGNYIRAFVDKAVAAVLTRWGNKFKTRLASGTLD
jgi:tetratricopeptide (TPR) repeat protein